MNDTHTTADGDAPRVERAAAAEELAALDPAEAPDLAEQLAAELAEDLETARAPQTEPTQLAVDIGDSSDPAVQ
jgi:hypothetical protein